jgi:hypothetical protein
MVERGMKDVFKPQDERHHRSVLTKPPDGVQCNEFIAWFLHYVSAIYISTTVHSSY